MIAEELLCLGEGEASRGDKDTIVMTLLAVAAKWTGEDWHLVILVGILDVVIQQ